MYKRIIVFITLLTCFFTQAQELERKWQLQSSENDFLELKEGTFSLKLSNDSIVRKGDYLIQDKYLFLFENGSIPLPKDFESKPKPTPL